MSSTLKSNIVYKIRFALMVVLLKRWGKVCPEQLNKILLKEFCNTHTRCILYDRYILGLAWKQIPDLEALSLRRVMQLHKQAIEKFIA